MRVYMAELRMQLDPGRLRTSDSLSRRMLMTRISRSPAKMLLVCAIASCSAGGELLVHGPALAAPAGVVGWKHGGAGGSSTFPSADAACKSLFDQDGGLIFSNPVYDGCVRIGPGTARAGWHGGPPADPYFARIQRIAR